MSAAAPAPMEQAASPPRRPPAPVFGTAMQNDRG